MNQTAPMAKRGLDPYMLSISWGKRAKKVTEAA
jgi:hypothetical protein